MLIGRCLCGGIRFEIEGTWDRSFIAIAQCAGMRMVRHSPRTRLFVRRSSGSSRGVNWIKEYESSPGNLRAFCLRCGSPIYGTVAEMPSIRRVRLGTLDSVDGAKSVAHIWTGSKSEWFEISDSLRQFENEPPEQYCAPGPHERCRG